MGDKATPVPQSEVKRAPPTVTRSVPSVTGRRQLPITGVDRSRGEGTSAHGANIIADRVMSGLSLRMASPAAQPVAHPALGRIRRAAGPEASVGRSELNPLGCRIVRRAYKSIGEENSEYAEPKFGGAAPKQKLPELMGTKTFLDPGLDLLYQQAAEAAPEFKKKVNALAAATGGKPQYRSQPAAPGADAGLSDAEKKQQRDRDNLDLSKGVGLKGRERATEKAKADYGGKATGLADLLGGTVEYDSFPNMVAGFQQCGAYGLEIVREKNRLLKPTAAGYRDIMLNVRLSNGHIAELQFNLTGMLAAKAKGHKQYEEARKMEAAHKQSNLPLAPEELSKLKGLYDEMRAIYQEAAEAAGAPVDPAELKRIFGA